RASERSTDVAWGTRARMALVLLVVFAGAAGAQTIIDTTGIRDVVRILDRTGRLLVQSSPPAPPVSRGPLPPLAPEQFRALSNTQSLRETGLLDEAWRTLDPVFQAAPHHPAVVTERALLLIARG